MLLETQLKVYGGVVNEADVFKLFKLTYRMSRGKVAVYTKSIGNIYTNLTNPEDVKPVSVFVMVFQNSEEMCRKVERVCEGYAKFKRDIKNAFEPEERELDVQELKELIANQTETIRQSRKTIREYLLGI